MSLKYKLNVLGKTKKGTKLFCVPVKKQITKIDKDDNKSVANISYKIKFIDSARFMASSLSNLVKNLEEKNYEIRFKDCHCFLEYERVKGNLIKYNCLSCNKDY